MALGAGAPAGDGTPARQGPALPGAGPPPGTAQAPNEPGRRYSLGAVPWWILVLAAVVTAALFEVRTNPSAAATFWFLSRGIALTLRITLVGFVLALALGLVAGIGRTSERRIARELATLYVEIVRGVPLLVLILWVGFGLTPWLLQVARHAIDNLVTDGHVVLGLMPAVQAALAPCRRPQACIPFEVRGVLGLAVGYGAYIAEVIRAGIESVSQGQREAALSVGMTRWQALRLVVLPQALRLALPPLGNDFISMLKDSSLVSILAVPELVQQARAYNARTFQAFAVWNMVAIMYLVMTTMLSLAVQWAERRVARPA